MKNNIYKLFIILFCLNVSSNYAQAPVRDRWDTLYANVDYANTTTFLYQHDLLKFGNTMALLSDSGDVATQGSYLQFFDPANNTLATINFQRLFCDKGTNAGAVYTSTSGVNYLFWGTRHNSNNNTEWGLYNYTSQTNAVNSETVALPTNVHIGVMNLGFFSPSTNDDSLSIFVNLHLNSDDSVWVFRKRYNQSGVIATGVVLPFKMMQITKVVTFNGAMYVAGYDDGNYGRLLKSTDGITFSDVSNYSSTYSYEWAEDIEILNNKMYLGIRSTSQGFKIISTPDGSNFTTEINNTNSFAVKSLESFNNTIWYSYFLFLGNKAAPGGSNSISSYAFNAPYVGYIGASNADVLSVDTLGRSYNDGATFKLQKLNSRLFLAGDYYVGTNTPGTFVYEFIPPVANFTTTGNNICANVPYTFSEQCSNVDSVRWYIDGDFYYSTANSINNTFSPGSHTIGLIGISGTQKDSMQYVVNAYAIGIILNPATSGCMNNKIPLTTSLTSAVNPVTYTWSPQATLTQTSISNPICYVTATAAGTYTYDVSVKDANGCISTSQNNLVIIGTNKDIVGAVDVTSTPLTAGNVVLYKYEPILTKFDSVTFQPLNASGTFTFATPDAFTYLLRCEPASNTLQITYAPSEINWKTATVVSHGCVNNTTQNISVIPILSIGTGPGVLAGKITEGVGYANKNTFSPGNPIGGLTIKGGKNPGGNIVAQGRTNSAGEYTFANLPANSIGEYYFILVDVPGLDTSSTYRRAITTNSMAFTDLDFVVDSAKINPTNDAGIKEIHIENAVVKIFPNPTNGILNIQFVLDKAQQTGINLFDVNGKLVRTIPSSGFQREVNVKADLYDVNAGVYFVKIKIGDAERTTRIVVTK